MRTRRILMVFYIFLMIKSTFPFLVRTRFFYAIYKVHDLHWPRHFLGCGRVIRIFGDVKKGNLLLWKALFLCLFFTTRKWMNENDWSVRLYLNYVMVSRTAATANRGVRGSNSGDGFFFAYTRFFCDKISSFYPDLHFNWIRIELLWPGGN